ncbi:nascent polypeptide-associated complex protein [Candidatus Bathyarchaeota archaeon]|nr:MAG: nascent polypeptide-associated complex protein [Candidatus Bathyarchaeota archaeon]
MARIDSRRARRMMKQMGLKVNELGDIERVILQGPGREIVIEGPTVTVIDVKGQRMYQVAGGKVAEKAVEKELVIPEEDVLLVAQQAGVSMERARAALEETEGDLARAILMLTTG